MKKCRAALIGINGFGRQHLNHMLHMQEGGQLEVAAVCELFVSSEDSSLLQSKGIACYTDYKHMLDCEPALDFVVLSTPIHLHAAMAIDIMESGCHVLLEKPPASVIQDVDSIIAASEKTGRICAVNFLTMSGKAFVELQRMMAAGELGSMITAITGTGLWQRTEQYTRRSPWSGKIKAGEQYVLDGTVHNPLSHLLNNLLVLSGSCNNNGGKGAVPVQVTAELYHANDIESEDTSCLRIVMSNHTELYFYATLCSSRQTTPSIQVGGSGGTAIWDYNNTLTVEKEGKSTRYEFEQENELNNMYLNLIGVINGETDQLICPVKATRNFMLAANGSFESSGRIHTIPSAYCGKVAHGGSTVTVIHQIEDIVQSASDRKLLFSELGVPWAQPTQSFDLRAYTRFPVQFV